jgi:hypothetical protein
MIVSLGSSLSWGLHSRKLSATAGRKGVDDGDQRGSRCNGSAGGDVRASVDLVGVVCLILLLVVGGSFGFFYDVANAVVGVLSAVVAWLSRPSVRRAGTSSRWPLAS